MLDVNIVNSFIKATTETLNITTGLTLTPSKPYVRNLQFTDGFIRIILGTTGAMAGQVIISIQNDKAKEIASKMMMGMPVLEFDEMSLSALSELGNMILGQTATNLSNNNILIDITPPVIERGSVFMNTKELQNLCIPFVLNNETILELNVIVKMT